MRYAKDKYGEGSPVFEVKMDQTEFAEQTGYLTTRELVERFMEAGRRLNSYRKGLLDYDEDDDDDEQEAVSIYDYDEPTHHEFRISQSQIEAKNRARMRDLKLSSEVQDKKADSGEAMASEAAEAVNKDRPAASESNAS